MFLHPRPVFLLPPFGFGNMRSMRHVRIAVIILLLAGGVLVAADQGTREWLEVNLFTVGTKDKQAKYQELAERHLGEGGIYADYLRRAEEMAEVIVFLDGAEIGVAERFEAAARRHEEQLLRETPLHYQALAAARVENENIFKFMVTKYQLTDADIDKHRAILGEHIAIVEGLLRDHPDAKAAAQIVEAKKHQSAGLNAQGYDLVKKAKAIVTSVLLRQRPSQ